jgi:predicted MFS family arabinose efflux permease
MWTDGPYRGARALQCAPAFMTHALALSRTSAAAIYVIAALAMLNHAGYAGSRMLLALYGLELGADQFTIGTIFALKALCSMLLGVYAGQLSDRLGPRRPMLWGSAGVALALSLPYFVSGLAVLYLAAAMMGISFQFFFVAAQGITGALGGPEQRARNYSILAVGFSLAAFAGPLIAGFSIDHLGHRAAFLALAATAVGPIALLALRADLLPGAAIAPAEGEARRSAFELLREPRLRNTFVASALVSTAWDLYLFYFPIYGKASGLSASVIGMVTASFAVAVLAIRVALPRIVRRWDEFRILTFAIALAGFAYLLFPLSADPFVLAGVSFLLGLGLGCGQPMSMSLIYALAPAGRAAEAAGVRMTFNHFTHLVVPLAFGGLGSALGAAPVFLFGSGAMLAGGYYGYRCERAAVRSR